MVVATTFKVHITGIIFFKATVSQRCDICVSPVGNKNTWLYTDTVNTHPHILTAAISAVQYGLA